jgi:hypothetical protein
MKILYEQYLSACKFIRVLDTGENTILIDIRTTENGVSSKQGVCWMGCENGLIQDIVRFHWPKTVLEHGKRVISIEPYPLFAIKITKADGKYNEMELNDDEYRKFEFFMDEIEFYLFRLFRIHGYNIFFSKNIHKKIILSKKQCN